ncbi:MAG: hypothetical protein O3A29_16385 [Planctomycetota bacterium]|nr:hypothetical protein [Planctomycetota bacterium]
MRSIIVVTSIVFTALSTASADDAIPDFDTQVAPLFRKYCQACHNEQDAEGDFVLESFSQLMDGTEAGAVIVPEKPDESRLLALIERKVEPFMPPEGSKGPSAEEIELIRAWIAGGAKNSVGRPGGQPLVTPHIAPQGTPRKPIHTVAWSPENRWIAIGQYGNVEILTPDKAQQIASLEGHTGNVNDLAVSANGLLLAAGSGETGLFGEVKLWSTADWQSQQTIRAHRDSIYAVEISPDETMLATASYDQEIKLWSIADGKLIRTLSGHNGPVYDLSFHPEGHILASASDDRTVKLWDVATGERLDTFSQPTKAQNAVAFSPDGRYVVGGGVDNRIRVWELGPEAREGTNIQRYARFAHQAAISKLVFSPDGKGLISAGEDQIIKIWEADTFTLQKTIERQPDWTPALAVSPDHRNILVGRMDGTLSMYPLATDELGTDDSPRPIVTSLEPDTEANRNIESSSADEIEPNNEYESSQAIAVPARINGILQAGEGMSADVDWVRFHSPAGKTWVIETVASRKQSPADTRIQVFYPDGQPVLRMLLRAVRDSAINFRPIDSTQNSARVDNYEEMELNQFMYIEGEVVKLFKMPEGPDSAYVFYAVDGKRKCYFDTSATVHPIETPVYIVEPFAPETELIDNGLPLFPLYYANDDDGNRTAGNDSRLLFTAPTEGDYLVQVRDMRNFSGPDFKYGLVIREPKPDFTVSLDGDKRVVAAGSGHRLTFKVKRHDEFEGPIRIDIANIPAGFSVTTPIVIEAGQLEARSVLFAEANAVTPTEEQWKQVTITATATVSHQDVVKEIGNLGEIKIDENKPKVLVILEPDNGGLATALKPGETEGVSEVTIAPGTTVTAMLRIVRNGADGPIRFDVDNLPHGVIVDNLGLNGITLLPGQNERQLFLSARPWVPESTRLIFAVSQSEGNQSSLPIIFHVRHEGTVARTESTP